MDLSSVVIDQLVEKKIKGLTPVCGDFTDLTAFSKYDFVYSRFTFHSIDEISENKVLNQLRDVLNDSGVFLLEARTLKDKNLYKKYGVNHYRRYLDFEETIVKIESKGFKILFCTESQGLSICEKEDPYLLRIIARKVL